MDVKLLHGDCLELMEGMENNRSFIGMELDDKYFEIAKERIYNVRMEQEP